MCLNGPIYKKNVCIGVNDVPIRKDIVNGTGTYCRQYLDNILER